MPRVERELRTFPRDDAAFRAAVEVALADIRTSDDVASRLEAKLRLACPEAVVHDGHQLAELVEHPRYVYRYGRPTTRP